MFWFSTLHKYVGTSPCLYIKARGFHRKVSFPFDWSWQFLCINPCSNSSGFYLLSVLPVTTVALTMPALHSPSECFVLMLWQEVPLEFSVLMCYKSADLNYAPVSGKYLNVSSSLSSSLETKYKPSEADLLLWLSKSHLYSCHLILGMYNILLYSTILMLYYAMLCYTVICNTISHYALPCFPSLDCAVLCCALLCYAWPCQALLYYAMCFAILSFLYCFLEKLSLSSVPTYWISLCWTETPRWDKTMEIRKAPTSDQTSFSYFCLIVIEFLGHHCFSGLQGYEIIEFLSTYRT